MSYPQEISAANYDQFNKKQQTEIIGNLVCAD
jgi:hypothetical protein